MSKRAIKYFGPQMETIKEAKINLTKLHNTIQIPKISSWTIKSPKIILTLCKPQKTKTLSQFSKNKRKLMINILDIHTFLWMVLSRRKQLDSLQYTMEKRLKISPKRYFHIQCGRYGTRSDSKIKKSDSLFFSDSLSVLT